MNPTTVFKLITLGLFSLSLTQASETKKSLRKRNLRINRLRSLNDSDTETLASETEAPAKQPSGVEALLATAAPEPILKVEPTKVARSVLTSVEAAESEKTVEPQDIETRRLDLFKRIYSLYHEPVWKYAKPDIIEWSRVDVHNWPEFIDKSDMSTWTEENVDFLNTLIDEGLLEFQATSHVKKNSPKPLAISSTVKEEPTENIAVKKEFSAKGRRLVQRKTPLVPKDSNVELSSSSDESDIVIRKKSSPSNKAIFDTSSSESDEEFILKKKRSSPSKKDLLETSSSESEVERIKKPVKSTFRSLSKKSPKAPKRTAVHVQVDSRKPADPAKRKSVLSKALAIYRKQTGDSAATEIDWSRSIVIYLQKHVLPFSTSFETEGDVLTLERLMKNKHFGFHNKSNTNSRRIRIYERIYELYAAVSRGNADDFFIKWEQINIEGWPAELNHSYSQWKAPDLDKLEALLDAGKIKITLKKEVAKEFAKRGKYDEESSSEGSYNSEESESDSSSESESDSSSGSKSVSSSSTHSSDLESVSEAETEAKREAEVASSSISASSSKISPVPVSSSPLFSPEKSVEQSSGRKHKYASLFLFDDEYSDIEDPVSVKKPKHDPVPFSGEFAGMTLEQLNSVKNRIKGTIDTFTAARQSYSPDSRRFKILNEMIRCMNLLVGHRSGMLPPAIDMEEISLYLEIFRDLLAKISQDRALDQDLWAKFLIDRTKLRARLAGIEYKNKDDGKRQMIIPKSRIDDFKTLGFLCLSESRWHTELDILELVFDNEDTEIFRKPNNKK